MKKLIVFLCLMLGISGSAQKKRKSLDITSNLEGRFLAMKAFGNNSLSKDFGFFYGFGFSGQLMTPLNFGLGLDYNLMFSNVKYGRQNRVGDLGSPQLTQISLNVIHRDILSEDFFLEEFVGLSIYRLQSSLYPGKEKFTEGNGGYNAGLNAVYTLDREGRQQFVFGVRGSGYFSSSYNENKAVKKYYSRSFLAGLSVAYRYNF